jgi:hypothetical protein
LKLSMYACMSISLFCKQTLEIYKEQEKINYLRLLVIVVKEGLNFVVFFFFYQTA